MKAFIRQNLLIISAVALPIIVILFYLVATLLPRYFVAPPQHDLIVRYQPTYYDYNNGVAEMVPSRVAIIVVEGRARAVVTEVPAEDDARRAQTTFFLPRVFRYKAASGLITEVDVPVPDDLATRPKGSEWSIPTLDAVELSPNRTAPDGYEFDAEDDRHRGLAVELFGGRSRPIGARISMQGRIIKIPEPEDIARAGYYAYRLQFVGWVIQ